MTKSLQPVRHYLVGAIGSASLCFSSFAFAATSTTDFEVISEGSLKSPNWVSGNFVGQHFRDLSNGILVAAVDSSSGGFDTALAANAPKVATKDVNTGIYVEGRFHAFGSGGGEWWYGPKISINWQTGGDQDGEAGWFENYIIDNASQNPAQLHTRLLNGFPGDDVGDLDNVYIGETEHDGSIYKHYLVYFDAWKQYWAVRQNYRNGGVTSIRPILDAWSTYDESLDDTVDGLSMKDRPFDGVKMNVESSGFHKRTFVFCDAYIPSSYNSAPTRTRSSADNEGDWCGSAAGLVAQLKGEPESVDRALLQSYGYEQLDANYEAEYLEALADTEYSNPPTTAEVQAVIDEVNGEVGTDFDNDGVLAINDACRNTSPGLQVDAEGCPTAAAFSALATSPASGRFTFADLEAVLGSVVVEAYMTDYEAEIAASKPQTEAELRSSVLKVNNEQLQGETNSGGSGGGGSVPMILLLGLMTLAMKRRRKS